MGWTYSSVRTEMLTEILGSDPREDVDELYIKK
jgi:hypothetical protein